MRPCCARVRMRKRSSDWEHLKGRLNRHGVVPGNLCFNLVEPLVQVFSGDWSQLQVLHEMFTCIQDEYAQWSKQDRICSKCWGTFFGDTIWRWRLWQKKKAGKRIEKDCRYGYKCWSGEQCQESGLDHAGQFNVKRSPVVYALLALTRYIFSNSTCASQSNKPPFMNES
ncbi:hypothetical protein L210DRAFT_3516652 [Boletus edulis BED1]|uniref:Uncharacterized protein n=1 Tax=Boletus edulis BED1 TaxID=1328754 RepID=A0AAD4GLR6_BOLED|nr:hypothetical protein L210DRAFT_3567457 [Boletus edulis BED1]KAF8452063.1 hypothetical protein L210DRAFT_3516652 [Boletus edulis BED1]